MSLEDAILEGQSTPQNQTGNLTNKPPTSSNNALLFIRKSPLGGAGGRFFLGNAFLSCKRKKWE